MTKLQQIADALNSAWSALTDAQSLASFNKDGSAITKQRITDLQAHIEWLEKQAEKERAIGFNGFVGVRL